jgi:uncharacterized protein YjlB
MVKKECMPLTWSERNYIWHALHSKKHEILESGKGKVYKDYVKDLNKLLKKFKR